MEIIGIVFVVGILVEALVEYGQLIFNKAINWKQFCALFIGVALAILAQVDIFAWFGIEFIVPYVGMVLTGIICSRGSNYIADFLKLIQNALSKRSA